MTGNPAVIGRRAPGCAAIARTSGESLRGTAAMAKGWLLIEHPGPWGVAPFQLDGPLGEVGVELQRRCAQLGVRLQLIRDPRRPRTDSSERRTYLVHSGRTGPWITRYHYRRVNQLLDLDIASAVAAIAPESGEPVLEPLYLVCTHGKKDPCCAVFGRPVVRALAEARSQVFESTHLGGDRFAGCRRHSPRDTRATISAANRLPCGRAALPRPRQDHVHPLHQSRSTPIDRPRYSQLREHDRTGFGQVVASASSRLRVSAS